MSADGILLVDKPRGPTSHDVVQWARRALGTRAIGHAGTLDPMATGLLVLAVGEGTKLVPYLTADDKRYLATVALGVETDTLDADALAPSEPITLERAREAARSFLGAHRQRPPTFSAIKIAGVPMHARARKGERVEAPEREVHVHALLVTRVVEGAGRAELDLDVTAAKGFYVRSLARDLARALGTRGHLSALRRVRSGPFSVEEAISGDLLRSASRDPEAALGVRAALRSLRDACRALPEVVLDDRGSQDAFHGRAIDPSRVVRGCEHAGREAVALIDAAGALIAIGSYAGDVIRVLRGFRGEGVEGRK